MPRIGKDRVIRAVSCVGSCPPVDRLHAMRVPVAFRHVDLAPVVVCPCAWERPTVERTFRSRVDVGMEFMGEREWWLTMKRVADVAML